ncbi:MAG TPA: DUF4397 domain-containing protein [Chitinophagaceae bacterium]|nr:DUF4397 domain-containing protein [Chitinophagaceae bacterium]
MKKNFLFTTIAVLSVASMVLFSACNKKSAVDNNPNSNAAGLMGFNLVPGKSVQITIGGNILPGSPLAFNNFTGTYLPIFPGTRTIESFDYSTGSSLATASDSFAINKYYSVFVVGTTGTYRNVIVNDNFESLTTAGKAYIRYINAINGPSNVSVNISGTGVNNSNAAFGSVSGFEAVTPGTATITASDGASINVNRTITTEANTVYTVLLSSGATSSDPAQIKYIVNGTLDNTSGQRISSAVRTATIK